MVPWYSRFRLPSSKECEEECMCDVLTSSTSESASHPFYFFGSMDYIWTIQQQFRSNGSSMNRCAHPCLSAIFSFLCVSDGQRRMN